MLRASTWRRSADGSGPRRCVVGVEPRDELMALIQRVCRASVSVDGEPVFEIGDGLLALLGS